MLISVISVDEVANGITSFYFFFFEQTVLSVLTIYKNEKKKMQLYTSFTTSKREKN